MAKFKVGDQVVGNAKANDYYDITREGWKGFVRKVYKNNEIRVASTPKSDVYDGYLVYEECFDLVKENYPKIVITTDGTITAAKLYENGKCTKTAEAKCNHKVDTFDFNEGAKWAFSRLVDKYPIGTKVEVIANTCWHAYPIGSVLTIKRKYNDEFYCVKEGDTYVTDNDIKPYVEPEKPKYYNGKVVCINSGGSSCFTEGKVYEIKNGKFEDNFGVICPTTSNRITCVEDLNNGYFSAWFYKFIPFVED